MMDTTRPYPTPQPQTGWTCPKCQRLNMPWHKKCRCESEPKPAEGAPDAKD